MTHHTVHRILTRADNFEDARKHVTEFFDKTTLIMYDRLEVLQRHALNGVDDLFWKEVESGVDANRKMMEGFAAELRESGVNSLDDLLAMTNPYSCKLLHIITHFLDGLIGIDTAFYSLIEDSHRVSDDLKRTILETPRKFWLLHVRGSFSSRERASFLNNA